jgi:hypothetical protein
MMTFAVMKMVYFLGGIWMKNLLAEDCIKIDSKIFMFAQELNLLYSVDENSGEISFVSKMPGEPMDWKRLSSHFLRYKNSIIFLPMNAECICIYDLDKGTWSKIEIEERQNVFCDRFFSGTISGDDLILVGHTYPSIVVVNLNTYEIKYIDAVYDELRELAKMHKDCYIRTNTVVIGDKLYAVSCVSNQVLIFDLKTYGWSWRNVGKEGNRYAGIAWDGKYFWLALRVKCGFVRWDFSTAEEYLFEDKDELFFLGAVYDGKNVIFPGMNSGKTYVINPDSTDVVSNIKIIDKSYKFWKKIDEVNVAMTRDGVLEIRDRESLNIVKRSYYVEADDERIMKHITEHIPEENCMIHENQNLTMEAFVKAI